LVWGTKMVRTTSTQVEMTIYVLVAVLHPALDGLLAEQKTSISTVLTNTIKTIMIGHDAATYIAGGTIYITSSMHSARVADKKTVDAANPDNDAGRDDLKG